jgi:hypothetical protein
MFSRMEKNANTKDAIILIKKHGRGTMVFVPITSDRF